MPQVLHRLRIVLGVGTAGHVPITPDAEPLWTDSELVGGFQLGDPLEYAHPRRAGRGDAQHLLPCGLIRLRRQARVAEKGF